MWFYPVSCFSGRKNYWITTSCKSHIVTFKYVILEVCDRQIKKKYISRSIFSFCLSNHGMIIVIPQFVICFTSVGLFCKSAVDEGLFRMGDLNQCSGLTICAQRRVRVSRYKARAHNSPSSRAPNGQLGSQEVTSLPFDWNRNRERYTQQI